MAWCYERSLKTGARKAIKRGTGTYRKYAVAIISGAPYIASVKKGKLSSKWYLVIKSSGPTIKAIESRS